MSDKKIIYKKTVEFNDKNELPPQLKNLFEDNDKNGIPDLMENLARNSQTKTQIEINGEKYQNWDAVPDSKKDYFREKMEGTKIKVDFPIREEKKVQSFEVHSGGLEENKKIIIIFLFCIILFGIGYLLYSSYF